MYYHIHIEAKNQNSPKIDLRKVNILDKDTIIKHICIPYLSNRKFNCRGRILHPDDIQVLKIVSSELSCEDWYKSKGENSSLKLFGPHGIILSDDSVDVTDEFMDIARQNINHQSAGRPDVTEYNSKKVFIVHGHDKELISQVARFLTDAELDPIILSEQPNKGQTIIEKFEENSDVNFAVILYTPCDKGCEAFSEDYKHRARQNVIFEHGFLIAKLGRKNVCALIKEEVEIPSDISGMVYEKVDDKGAWKIKVAKEIKAAGLDINIDNILTTF